MTIHVTGYINRGNYRRSSHAVHEKKCVRNGSDGEHEGGCHPEPPELRRRSRSSAGRSKDPPCACHVRVPPPVPGYRLGGPSTVLRRSALRAPTPPAAQDDNRSPPA